MRAVIDLRSIARRFLGAVPHLSAVGIKLESVEKGRCVLSMSYSDDLVGDPVTGVLHGGAVTTLIDSAFGLAVLTALDQPKAVATLDLRIDYLCPALPKRDLRADAHCFRLTRQIAFVRGVAYHDDAASPIAAAQASFMISSGKAAGAVRGGRPL